MSIDIARSIIECDGEGCTQTVNVPITFRQWYDTNRLELRNESSAAGWLFLSSAGRDKHFCPACGEKHMTPKHVTHTTRFNAERP